MYNKEIIGLEGVPNIYVDDISIEYSRSGSELAGTLVNINMFFNNALETVNRPVFKYMNQNGKEYSIRLIHFYSEQVFSTFLELNSVRRQNEYIKLQQRVGNLKVEYLSLPRLNMSNLRMNRLTKVQLSKKVFLENKTKTYAFLACIMKRDGSLIGPTTAEMVLRNSIVANDSFYYVKRETQEIWTGPVHIHDNVAMAGSFHTNKAHPVLEKVISKNFKIKDYRSPRQVNLPVTVKNVNNTNKYYFSNLEFSQGQGGLANFMFSINTKNMIVNLSKYSSILKEYNQAVFNLIAQNVSIRRLDVSFIDADERRVLAFSTKDSQRILKQKYYYRQKRDSVPKSSDTKRSDLILFSRVSEILLDNNPNLRTVAFQINSSKISDINVSVEIDDPFERYLQQLLEGAKNAKKTLLSYRNKIFTRQYYSRETKTFDKQALVRDYETRTDLWFNPVGTFMIIRSLIEKLDMSAINFETDRAFEYISPKTCTPKSVDFFISQMAEAISLLVSKYSIKAKNSVTVSPSGQKASQQRQFVMTKEYDINFKKNSKTLSYFQQLSDTYPIPVITQTQFRSLLNNEKNKFQRLNNILDATSFVAGIDNVNSTNSDLYDSSYFSPLIVTNRDKNLVFSKIENLNEEKLKELATNETEINLGTAFGKNLFVEKYEEDVSTLSRSEDNLGTGTNFTQNVDQFRRQILRTPPNKKIIQRLGNQNRQQKLLRVLDPKNEQNYLSNKTTSDALRIPFQLRTLFDTRQITEIFGSRSELFNNRPFTTDVVFFNLKKILYYDRYESDKQDRILIGAPRLREYNLQTTNEDVLYCRLVNYEQPDLKSKNNFDNFTSINSFFVVIPDGFVFEKTRNISQIQSAARLQNNLRASNQRRYYQNEYLRTVTYKEPRDRDRTTLKQMIKRPTALGQAAQKVRQRREEREVRTKKDKYEIAQEKIDIMSAKSSNKEVAREAERRKEERQIASERRDQGLPVNPARQSQQSRQSQNQQGRQSRNQQGLPQNPITQRGTTQQTTNRRGQTQGRPQRTSTPITRGGGSSGY